MSSRVKAGIERDFEELGMCWAVSQTKCILPDDPMEDQLNHRRTWHVHPDCSNPRQEDIKRFDTLGDLGEWIEEVKAYVSGEKVA